jgi:hypothetical protein
VKGELKDGLQVAFKKAAGRVVSATGVSLSAIKWILREDNLIEI